MRKTSILIKSIFLGIALLTVSCTSSDDSKLFRAYVEGKLVPGQEDLTTKPIQLKNNATIVGESFAKPDGQFVIAGPYESGSLELVFAFKIKSITTNNPQCKISSDSLKVLIPEGVTYLLFDEIKFK